MSQPIEIFDKELLKKRFQRADREDYLVAEAADMLNEHLLDIKRDFKDVLEIDRFDEVLPDGEDQYDLIKSSLHLHFINDIPGVLAQAKRLLKPDGLFIANFFGGETLKELRASFVAVEKDSISPRISPMIDVRDAGALLQRAGFALPVADVEKIEGAYMTPFHLMKHLKKIGENNALVKRSSKFMGKDFLMKVADAYADNFMDEEGRVQATFEIVTITGWKPAANQQQPLKPGSATKSLIDEIK